MNRSSNNYENGTSGQNYSSEMEKREGKAVIKEKIRNPFLRILEKVSPRWVEILETQYYKFLFGNIINANLDNYINGSPLYYFKDPREEELVLDNYDLTNKWVLFRTLKELLEKYSFDKEFTSDEELQKFISSACKNTPLRVRVNFCNNSKKDKLDFIFSNQRFSLGANSNGSPQYWFGITYHWDEKEGEYFILRECKLES